jgi:hypothetical protein
MRAKPQAGRRRVGTLAALLAGLALLGSCTAAPPATPLRFSQLQLAPAGMARLYVLRPGINALRREDNPALRIAEIDIVQLAHRSYTAVDLAPGRYVLALQAGAHEAPSWNSKLDFSVAADGLYFLAVWKELDKAAAATAASGAAALPARPLGVSYEFLDQTMALPAMLDLAYLQPRQPRLSPLQGAAASGADCGGCEGAAAAVKVSHPASGAPP